MGRNTPLASGCRYQSGEKKIWLCPRRHDGVSEGNRQQDQPHDETCSESHRFLTTQTALCDAGWHAAPTGWLPSEGSRDKCLSLDAIRTSPARAPSLRYRCAAPPETCTTCWLTFPSLVWVTHLKDKCGLCSCAPGETTGVPCSQVSVVI